MTEPSWLTPGPECLTPAQLEKAAEGQAEAQAQTHLSGCAICQAEVALLREFLEAKPQADEIAAVRTITAQLENRPWQGAKASWWERWGLRSWAPMATAALAAMLALVVWVVRPDGPRVSHEVDVMRSGSVTLLAPLNDISAWPSQFSWSPVAGAARYTVRLLAVDGTVIWTGEASGTAISVPAHLVQAGRVLDWSVHAYDASGQRIAESGRARIRWQAATP